MKKKQKPIRLWGGFIGGKLDVLGVDTGWGGWRSGADAEMPAVFKVRAKARQRYRDVRRVEIREVKP